MGSEKKIRGVVNIRPHPIPIEMRPLWRISLIICAINVVSGDKQYLDGKKLNILIWMLIRKARWSEYGAFLLSQSKELPLVSVDTATYKAVEFSVAKGLIRLADGRVYISEKGLNLYLMLIENEIMVEEIEFLELFGKKLTENKVKQLTGELL